MKSVNREAQSEDGIIMLQVVVVQEIKKRKALDIKHITGNRQVATFLVHVDLSQCDFLRGGVAHLLSVVATTDAVSAAAL